MRYKKENHKGKIYHGNVKTLTVEKTKELKKEIDDKNIEEKIVSIGTYIIERENKLTMYDFANKLKNELTNRKIIKTTFNIQDISGNYRVQIYDKSGNIVYDKKIIDIFRKGNFK